MDSEVEVEFKGGYINIRHGEGFEITPEKTDEFWNFLSKVCEENDCSRVLTEGSAPKRKMDTVAAFHSGVQAAAVRKDLRLAIYFRNYEPDELSELFERAARNRGVHVRFFDDKRRALNWLGVGE